MRRRSYLPTSAGLRRSVDAMSVSEAGNESQRNSLYSIAAVGGILLGAFLLAGAYGHFAAVWPGVTGEPDAATRERFSLLFPGIVLAATGVVNVALCRALWTGTYWALQLALAMNLLAAVYLGYLLTRGVPGHPIGEFLAVVLSYVVLLGAIRMGLIWPGSNLAE